MLIISTIMLALCLILLCPIMLKIMLAYIIRQTLTAIPFLIPDESQVMSWLQTVEFAFV